MSLIASSRESARWKGMTTGQSRRSGAGADAEHDASPREVVEEDHAVGDVKRVVVGDGDDAGAEADVLRALAGGGDEDFGAGDRLPATPVMLADPRLVEAEVVGPGGEAA